MRMATRSGVEYGHCTLTEVRQMIEHVKYRAIHLEIQLCWRYNNGVYTAYAKKAGEILFQKDYTGKSLFDTIIEMHFDFNDYVMTNNLRVEK